MSSHKSRRSNSNLCFVGAIVCLFSSGLFAAKSIQAGPEIQYANTPPLSNPSEVPQVLSAVGYNAVQIGAGVVSSVKSEGYSLVSIASFLGAVTLGGLGVTSRLD